MFNLFIFVLEKGDCENYDYEKNRKKKGKENRRIGRKKVKKR